jgi:hypothetical protein
MLRYASPQWLAQVKGGVTTMFLAWTLSIVMVVLVVGMMSGLFSSPDELRSVLLILLPIPLLMLFTWWRMGA